MGQMTKRTNPTGLKIIDKKYFSVRVENDNHKGRFFWLDNFDYRAAQLDPSVHMGCIVHAGNTEEYFDLGQVSNLNTDPIDIRTIATDKPLNFRFIFNHQDKSLLVGYAEGVKALNEASNLGSSLVDIEPANLNGPIWKLELPQSSFSGEKPNILVDKNMFPTVTSAVNHPWFSILVMPEVMRQIALEIAKENSELDDTDTWIGQWANFIKALGIDQPIESEYDETVAQDWADQVVTKFTSKGIFKHHIAIALAEIEGGHP